MSKDELESVAATNHNSGNEDGVQSRSHASDSVTANLDDDSMFFDLDIDHELDLFDFGPSPTSTNCTVPPLAQLDWINESNVPRSQMELRSPCTAQPIDDMRSIHISDVQDIAVSSSRPALLSHTPTSISQSPNGALPSATPSSAGSTGSRGSDFAQSNDTPRSNSSGLSVKGESSSPLLTAIYLGNIEIARLLISAGAKIDTSDEHGNTPLHVAIEAGNVDMIRMLLDWCARNSEGAVRKEDEQPGNITTNLLRRCIDARDARNMTAVHLSVALQRVEILKVLMEYGANVNIGCD